MLEKDVENLIARYPSEFFPNQKLTLQGQQVKLGGCRADILFTDTHGRTIIIEVKRGILSRDAAGQAIEYYGMLKQQQPNAIVELVICANVIPYERRLFLENAGIECKELGLSTIQNVAIKYNYRFLDDRTVQQNGVQPTGVARCLPETVPASDLPVGTWVFQANPSRYDVLNALSDPEVQRHHWQVNQHKRDIKKGDRALIWMSGKEAGIYALADIASEPTLKYESPAEEKYWMSVEDKGVRRLRVELINRIVLINTPIYRYELKAIDRLKTLSILRAPQGTNFPVSSDEWNIVRNLIDSKMMRRTPAIPERGARRRR